MRRLLDRIDWFVPILACVLVPCASSGPLGAQTLRITSPADGAVVSPGDKITVTVEVSGGSVPFVALGIENPIGYSEILPAAPYQFSVQIPSRVSLRRYPVYAGFVGKGKEGSVAAIFIDVERPDGPTKLEVEPSLLVPTAGTIGYLSAYATYVDSTRVEVTQSTLTRWSSDSPGVAAVSDLGVVTAIRPGSAKIFVQNGGQTAIVPVTVSKKRAGDLKP